MTTSRYERLEAIGHGAMGIVWRAHDRERGITVALKTLRPELAHWAEVVACLKAEANVCSRMLSPHVVQVLDSSDEPGDAYIAYELLCGQTLAARLERDSTLPLHVVRDVVIQLSRALTRVHSLGVVHRDVKPDNVFLVPRPGGRFDVKLIDFGIADAGAHPVDFAGTPEYMPPEVLVGHSRATASADFYALGVLAYECLTGRCPYGGSSVCDIVDTFETEATPVDTLRTDIGADVGAWMRRAIHRQPTGRFPSAKAMGEAFARTSIGTTAAWPNRYAAAA